MPARLFISNPSFSPYSWPNRIHKDLSDPSRHRARPLVIGLHAKGETEDFFFSDLIFSKLPGFCQYHDWILAAPRGGITPDLIDKIDELYPVDRRRVFLVGYGEGGAQAVEAACRTPNEFAAVAVLGSGGSVMPSPRLRKVPFYIAVGREDPAAKAARALANNLRNAGAGSVRYVELPDVEHLAIVELGMDDAMEHFVAIDQKLSRQAKRAAAR